MKQGKKLLCVLLALIMALSCLTIGVSAAANPYWFDYTKPDHYDAINKPVFTPDQGASALLDYVDDLLYNEVGLNETYAGYHIEITSLSSTLTTVDTIINSGLYKVLTFLANLGDIESLNADTDIVKDSGGRHRRGTESEVNFLIDVLSFIADNADPLYKFIGNKFEVGAIKTLDIFDPQEELAMLSDIHGMVNELVYGLIIEEVDFENNPTKKAEVDAMQLDGIVQDFLDNRLIKFVADMFAEVDDKGYPSNPVAEFLGLTMNADGTLHDFIGLNNENLFPSLYNNPGSTSISGKSLYDWIKNIFHSLVNDVAVKYGGELILEALDLNPYDTTAEELQYIDIAVGLFVTEEDFPEGTDNIMTAFYTKQGCPNPDNPYAIDKLNAALRYILGTGVKLHDDGRPEGIQKFIRFQEDGQGGKYLMLDEQIEQDLPTYVKTILPMLNGFSPKQFPALTSEQLKRLDTMDDQQSFAFLAQYLLTNLVKEVKFNFDRECNSIKELATWTLVNVSAELLPDIDFEADIDNGIIDPNDLNDCLDIAATVVSYYLNGEFGMGIDYEGASFENVLTQAFDFFLEKYAVLFNREDYQYSGQYDQKVWHELYYTVNQWIPLTNIAYGVENSISGMKSLIMDKIIGSVLNFDLGELFSLIGQRPDANAEFTKPLTKVLANLLARIINGVFQLPVEGQGGVNQNELIIPYSYGTLDQILTLNPADKSKNLTLGLQNTAYRLILNIPAIATGSGSLVRKSADLIATLLNIIDTDEFEYMKYHFNGETHSINELTALYNRLAISDNEGVKYYEDNYQYFHMVDFTPWVYLEFKSALSDAGSVIEKYNNAKAGTGVAPDRTAISYAYYTLAEYEKLIIAHRREASDYQLDKTMSKFANAAVGTRYAHIPALIYSVEHDVEADQQDVYSLRTYNAFKNAWLFAKKVEAEFTALKDQGKANEYRQSKINTARSELIEAVQNLKQSTPLAYYGDLDGFMDSVYRLNIVVGAYNRETVDRLVEAYKNAKYLDRDYDMDDQPIVNEAYDDLMNATAGLKVETEVSPYGGELAAASINYDKQFIYGLGYNLYPVEEQLIEEEYGFYGDAGFTDYFNYAFGYVDTSKGMADPEGTVLLKLIPNSSNGHGTGAQIQVYSTRDGGEEVLGTYDNVVFGDVDGDGQSDGMDVVIMRMYAGFMIEKKLTSECVYYAGDVDGSGAIATADINAVAKNGIMKAEIDQRPAHAENEIVTFQDLVG